MRKGWMNSYAKFGGAARRHFSAICEKPMGGTYVPPPAVRGLTRARVAVSATFAMVGGGGQNDPPSNSKTRKARRPDDTAIDRS